MTIGIIGAGAMGSLYSSYFYRGGLKTVIYENDPAIVEAMQKGITLLTTPPEVLPIPVSGDIGILSECAAVFLFIKSHATEKAVQDISGSLAEDAIVVSLQNGIGNYEKIREFFPAERIVYGTTSMGATKKDAGSVVPGGAGTVIIGGHNMAAVRTVYGVLVHCAINVVITDDPASALWKKAIVNAAINPLGALLGVPNGSLVENDESLKLQEIIVDEAVQAATAAGISVDKQEMLDLVRDICIKTGTNICSMLQDIRAGRKTEIDSINGEIIKAGRDRGIALPCNETLYLLVRAMEKERRG